MGLASVYGVIGSFFLLSFFYERPRYLLALFLILGRIQGIGFLWLVSWLFFPHFLVAYHGTLGYWHTDPLVCVVGWLVACVGTYVSIGNLIDVIYGDKKKEKKDG